MDKVSPIFGESISTGKINKRGYSGKNKKRGFREYAVPIIIIGVFFVLVTRLFFLQVVQGSYYRMLSDGNRVKTVVVHAPRGVIFDRNGEPLVFNVPGFRQTKEDKTEFISEENAIEMIAEGKENLEIDSLRSYPYKQSMAHVLGYIGQISEDELKSDEFTGYKSGDIIGKMGIEREYEDFLKGVNGKQLAETDSSGNVIRKLGETDAVPGRDITVTLDAKLQEKAYSALKDKERGAVVVSTPKGEILALVSHPSFDPNLFTLGSDYETASDSAYTSVDDLLSKAENQPFLNRTIGGHYPPGSTYKIITAASGLESKSIDENYTVEDTGILRVGDFSYANWYFTNYGGKDGDVDVVKGLQRSNDIFFYKLAEKIGVDQLARTSRDFLIDKKLGIDLPGEIDGTVPDPQWKEKTIGESWYLGDTFIMGIGQGYLLSTPLQVNSWSQVVASGGDLYRPHLLKDLGEEKVKRDLMSDKTIELIREGMIKTCAPKGTAWPLFNFQVKNPSLEIDGKNILEAPAATTSANFKDQRQIVIACKTGTAEHGGEKTLPHAWITLFAPAYDPEIVITVLAEESGEGSSEAAPIAKEILEEWFNR